MLIFGIYLFSLLNLLNVFKHIKDYNVNKTTKSIIGVVVSLVLAYLLFRLPNYIDPKIFK